MQYDLYAEVEKRLGPWDKVRWERSRRHRRWGFTRVWLPERVLLPCPCGSTLVYRCSPGDLTGFEAVVDDSWSEYQTACLVIVYQKNGQVRHQRCGKTILSILPPCVPLMVGGR